MDYGSGGRKTAELIDELIVPALENEALRRLDDGAVLLGEEKLVFSTDSFVVSPRFFPGGDIGKLAVCGTVNDVAMCGGEPQYLSLSFIIEEGLPTAELKAIIASEQASSWLSTKRPAARDAQRRIKSIFCSISRIPLRKRYLVFQRHILTAFFQNCVYHSISAAKIAAPLYQIEYEGTV